METAWAPSPGGREKSVGWLLKIAACNPPGSREGPGVPTALLDLVQPSPLLFLPHPPLLLLGEATTGLGHSCREGKRAIYCRCQRFSCGNSLRVQS